MTSNAPIPATRTEALRLLQAFVPHAGRTYAATRNHDRPDQGHSNVSRLSPYLRHRIITEADVLEAVLGRHSAAAAEKFVQEVYWRTYWKGWLEMRPGVWADYRRDLDTVMARDDGDLARAIGHAEDGETGIDAFNAWARELRDTGYLSNHARMWAASIWIFTLCLPWEAGADWFMRNLLDGDPASNTLSWRWVAGLQTRGKAYVARASNIARYTDGTVRSQGPAERDADALGGPRAARAPRTPRRWRTRAGVAHGTAADGGGSEPAFRAGASRCVASGPRDAMLRRTQVAGNDFGPCGTVSPVKRWPIHGRGGRTGWVTKGPLRTDPRRSATGPLRSGSSRS
jgi:hypothetical protein